MAISKRRMTAAEFEALRPLLHGMSQDRLNAARACLVDGIAQQAAATPYGWTRQAVNDAITVVWKTLQDYRAAQSKSANAGVLLPPGWEQVTLIAPTALIEIFRAEIADYVSDSIGERQKGGKLKRATVRTS